MRKNHDHRFAPEHRHSWVDGALIPNPMGRVLVVRNRYKFDDPATGRRYENIAPGEAMPVRRSGHVGGYLPEIDGQPDGYAIDIINLYD